MYAHTPHCALGLRCSTHHLQLRYGEELHHWAHTVRVHFKLSLCVRRTLWKSLALLIFLLLRRLANSLHLGIKVRLSQQKSASPTFPQERKVYMLTPSTNETKLKNGTQSCVKASLARDKRYEGWNRPQARETSEQIQERAGS